MPKRPFGGNPKIGPEDLNVVLKFGGGLHTRASPDEIDQREAASGFNFLIDLQNRNLRNRPPFDLVGTAPNGASINGGASLLKTNGSVTTIFQAGGNIYKWDGATSFTLVGTTNAQSKLRGHWRSHTWNLTDVILITDLALLDVVNQWDGATFKHVSFKNEGAAAFGAFYAKYCDVSDERAIFSNVRDSSGNLPHMMVGSERSDYTTISVVNIPTTALGDADPFFLLSPDLKPINGFINSFKTSMISTEKGQIYVLTGSGAKDFGFDYFYANSAASGVESIEEIGNDFLYGRQGRIESIRDTNTFGNSQSADLTALVADQVSGFVGWTNVFNTRTRKAYCFPTGVSQVWVLDAAIRDSNQLSPWMRYQTQHSMAFMPTMVMSMLDPKDGLEYIFMGDASGNIYRMEGTGASGDGGTTPIEVQFTSKVFSARLDAAAYEYEVYVKYLQNLAATVTLTFHHQGESVFDKSITLTLPAAPGGSFYNDSAYYSGNFFYSTTTGKIARAKGTVAGQDNDFQVLVDVTGNNNISINEIGIRFKDAS